MPIYNIQMNVKLTVKIIIISVLSVICIMLAFIAIKNNKPTDDGKPINDKPIDNKPIDGKPNNGRAVTYTYTQGTNCFNTNTNFLPSDSEITKEGTRTRSECEQLCTNSPFCHGYLFSGYEGYNSTCTLQNYPNIISSGEGSQWGAVGCGVKN